MRIPIAAVLFILGVNTAAAQNIDQQIDICVDGTPNQRVKSCTWLLESWQTSTENRGIIHSNLGSAYEGLGQFDLAVQHHNEAVRLDPNNPVSFFNFGLLYYELEQYESSIWAYSEAIRIDPEYAFAFNNRGNSYSTLGHYDRAIQDYQEALRLDPKNETARQNLTLAQNEMNQQAGGQSQTVSDQFDICAGDYGERSLEACTWLIDSGQLSSEDLASAYFNRGLLYGDQGRLDLAILDYDQSIRLTPDDVGHRINRGQAYRELGQYDMAIRDFDEAIRIDPAIPVAYNSRGIAYMALRQYEQAIRDYDAAIQLDPDYVYPYINRAHSYSRLGRFEDAVGSYESTIRLDPSFAPAHNNLAWLFATEPSLYDARRAIEHANLALQVETKASYYSTLAAAYVLAGQTDRAMSEYERYFRTNSENAIRTQEWLRDEGYYTGSVDGLWGPGTRGAIRACVQAGCQIFAD